MPPPKRHISGKALPRQGASIIPVIAFFAIAMVLVATWVRTSLEHHRLVRRWHEKTQVDWLAEAGVRRAVVRVDSEPKYDGELWQVTAASIGKRSAAEVEIQIRPKSSEKTQNRNLNQVEIVAIARYPTDAPKRVQSTKKLIYQRQNLFDTSGE